MQTKCFTTLFISMIVLLFYKLMIFIISSILIQALHNILSIDYYKINIFYLNVHWFWHIIRKFSTKKHLWINISAQKQCCMLVGPALCEAFSFIYPLADSELYTSFSRVSLRSSWQWQCLSWAEVLRMVSSKISPIITASS